MLYFDRIRKVPCFILCGSDDVPFGYFEYPFEQRKQEMGGRQEMVFTTRSAAL